MRKLKNPLLVSGGVLLVIILTLACSTQGHIPSSQPEITDNLLQELAKSIVDFIGAGWRFFGAFERLWEEVEAKLRHSPAPELKPLLGALRCLFIFLAFVGMFALRNFGGFLLVRIFREFLK